MKVTYKLWIGIAILAALTPLGLIIPDHFKAGGAWGEWGVEDINRLTGYIPEGLKKIAGLWNAPIPDYFFKGWAEKDKASQSLTCIISAIIGISITAIFVVLIGKMLAKKGD